MKKAGVGIVLLTALFLVGCQNKELVKCRQDNQTLQSQTTALQQELTQSKAAVQQKDAEIAKIKAENVDMQNKAMESIMNMLKKEEERSKKLQASIAQKDEQLKAESDKTAASEQKTNQLQKQIETLKADLAKANQAVETLKAQAAQATPAAQQ